MIRLIIENENDIYRNLAMEHALVQLAKGSKVITIRIWKNQSSVILGRNQNIRNEVDLNYCKINRIEIGRRISGGGTVYHDLGNLNTSFLLPIQTKMRNYNNILDMGRYLTRIQVKTLEDLGLQDLGILNGTNILLNEKKISGSAGYYFKNWFVHHATLLMHVKLDHLEGALKAKEMNPQDKKLSKYYPTINIGYINESQWIKSLGKQIASDFNTKIEYGSYSQEELELCQDLESRLYRNVEWIHNAKRSM